MKLIAFPSVKNFCKYDVSVSNQHAYLLVHD
jgi:hypothetical protein